MIPRIKFLDKEDSDNRSLLEHVFVFHTFGNSKTIHK
jgi:hypothetical protein